MIQTGAMFLVYVSESGETVLQPWQDVDVSGTPIDPETDREMELVGWTVEAPSSPAPAVCATCGAPADLDPEYGGYVHTGGDSLPDRTDRGHYADPFS